MTAAWPSRAGQSAREEAMSYAMFKCVRKGSECLKKRQRKQALRSETLDSGNNKENLFISVTRFQ